MDFWEIVFVYGPFDMKLRFEDTWVWHDSILIICILLEYGPLTRTSAKLILTFYFMHAAYSYRAVFGHGDCGLIGYWGYLNFAWQQTQSWGLRLSRQATCSVIEDFLIIAIARACCCFFWRNFQSKELSMQTYSAT